MVRLCFVIGIAALVAPAATAADAPKPPPGNGAVSVYVEQIPTAKGSVAAGRSNNSTRAVPPKVKKQLEQEAGTDAAGIEAAATSSGYGAPQSTTTATTTPATTTSAAKPQAKPKPKPSAQPTKAPQAAAKEPTPRSSEETAAASPTAASDEGDTFLPILAVVAAVALIGVALAVSRGRLRRPRTR